ncbi:hypothetical protein QR680_003702 [Steinernema hermaphroditum]|uniref:Uncharacterized protein n=1 Tax=Steinernema hermaphroditum TaxID=289476 RepID=A0AA39HNH8_9BILA|nr:hypothetical protein QR680_003702 [Steinernema hermaphroditum]
MIVLSNTIIGMAYLLVATILFLLNGLLFLVLTINKEFHTNTYRIIKNLFVACMLQLFVIAAGGIMTVAQSSFNQYFEAVKSYFDMIMFSLVFVMYLSLVAYLIKLKISSKLPSSKAELRILLVAIICFICEALYVIFGYWILPETTLPDLTIVIVVNFAWMIECGLFAISTMAVNSRVRRRVAELVFGKKDVVVVFRLELK